MKSSQIRFLAFGCVATVVAAIGSSCSPTESTCEERGTCVTDEDGGGSPSGGNGQGGDDSGETGGSTNTGGSMGGGGGDPGTGGSDPGPCGETCSGDTPFCDEEAGECVACLSSADCDDPENSVCDAGECTPCVVDNHCSHITDKNVCDDGTCVECTIETEGDDCDGKSCNPATGECTNTNVASRNVCQTCVADSECKTDYRCVPMKFDGNDRDGGYCLKIAATGCSQPYTVPTSSRISLSEAAAAVYCGINETVTTCEALLDLTTNQDCTVDDDCGVPGLDDGRCESVSFVANKCSYSCTADSRCPSDFSCGTNPGNEYCGGPTM